MQETVELTVIAVAALCNDARTRTDAACQRNLSVVFRRYDSNYISSGGAASDEQFAPFLNGRDVRSEVAARIFLGNGNVAANCAGDDSHRFVRNDLESKILRRGATELIKLKITNIKLKHKLEDWLN